MNPTEKMQWLKEDERRNLIEYYVKRSWYGCIRNLPILKKRICSDDVVQKVFEHIIEKFDECRGNSVEEIVAWLRTTAENRVRSIVRFETRKKRNVCKEVNENSSGEIDENEQEFLGSLQAPSTKTPGTKVAEIELQQLLIQNLNQLPEDEKRIVELREFQGLTWKEISEIMEMPPHKCISLYANAILKLKKLFSSE